VANGSLSAVDPLALLGLVTVPPALDQAFAFVPRHVAFPPYSKAEKGELKPLGASFESINPTLRLAITRAFQVVLVVMAAWVLTRIGNGSISRFLERRPKRHAYLEEKRAKTLASLLRSIFRYSVDFAAILTVLGLFNVPVASVLALSGFIGLAVGFGAQNLVKDIIAGFFILFEDEYTVGETIETAGLTGTVEDIGLRTTRLRDFGGQLHTLPNGMVDKVTNLSRGNMRAEVEVPVPYQADPEATSAALNEAIDEVRQGDPEITGGPRILGVTALGPAGVTYLIQADTVANSQWRVERELRQAILRAFQRHGLPLGHPTTAVVRVKRETAAADEPPDSGGPPDPDADARPSIQPSRG